MTVTVYDVEPLQEIFAAVTYNLDTIMFWKDHNDSFICKDKAFGLYGM